MQTDLQLIVGIWKLRVLFVRLDLVVWKDENRGI